MPLYLVRPPPLVAVHPLRLLRAARRQAVLVRAVAVHVVVAPVALAHAVVAVVLVVAAVVQAVVALVVVVPVVPVAPLVEPLASMILRLTSTLLILLGIGTWMRQAGLGTIVTHCLHPSQRTCPTSRESVIDQASIITPQISSLQITMSCLRRSPQVL